MTLLQTITGVFSSPARQAAAWGMAASFALCVLLVLTKRWHGALTMDHCVGVQKFHTAPTPRIGGVTDFVPFSWYGLEGAGQVNSCQIQTSIPRLWFDCFTGTQSSDARATLARSQ